MVGLAWAALCVGAAWLWHRHLEWSVLAIALVWTAMPGVARSIFALGPIDLHPAAVLALVTFVVQLVRDRHRLLWATHQSPGVTTLLGAVALAATLETLMLSRGPEGVMFAVEQVLCTIAVVVLTGAALLDRPAFAGRLAGWLVALVAVQSVLATAQAGIGQAVLYQSSFEKQYWYGKASFDRWMGTTDHPLVLSLMIVMVAPLLARRMNGALRAVALVALAAGILAAQSRTGIAVFTVEVVYLLARARMGFLPRLVTAVTISLGIALAAVMGAFTNIILRLTTDDGGSADARARSVDWILANAHDYAWLGLGMNQNYSLAGAAGFGTSFENSFIMQMIDMGLPVALTYYGCMLACLVVGLVRGAPRGAVLGGAVGFVVIMTFSALGDRTASAAFLWMVLALALYGRRDPDEALETA